MIPAAAAPPQLLETRSLGELLPKLLDLQVALETASGRPVSRTAWLEQRELKNDWYRWRAGGRFSTAKLQLVAKALCAGLENAEEVEALIAGLWFADVADKLRTAAPADDLAAKRGRVGLAVRLLEESGVSPGDFGDSAAIRQSLVILDRIRTYGRPQEAREFGLGVVALLDRARGLSPAHREKAILAIIPYLYVVAANLQDSALYRLLLGRLAAFEILRGTSIEAHVRLTIMSNFERDILKYTAESPNYSHIAANMAAGLARAQEAIDRACADGSYADLQRFGLSALPTLSRYHYLQSLGETGADRNIIVTTFLDDLLPRDLDGETDFEPAIYDLNAIGYHSTLCGDFDRAEWAFDEAIRLSDEMGEEPKFVRGLVRLNEGRLRMARARDVVEGKSRLFEAAERRFRLAEQLFAETGNETLLIAAQAERLAAAGAIA